MTLYAATIDGRPTPALVQQTGQIVTLIPLRSVALRQSRVAVCAECGSAPDSPEARVCTAVRCPLAKADVDHGERL